MITKGDKFLIIFVLISSVLIFVAFNAYGISKENNYAVIEVNGELYQKISLGKKGPNLKIKVNGPLGETEVEVAEDKVRINSSPCPDKNCINQGWIEKPGQVLVCLPNRVVVKIEGKTQTNVDVKTF